jgi:uncharacterized damage-inducible protein DinB
MPAERKTRDEVLKLVRSGRAELEAALARIPEKRIEEPLLDGGWSAKDLMAHVAHWEMAFLSNLGEPPPPVLNQGSEEATNRAVFEYHRGRGLADVRREFEDVHSRLVERVSQFDDDGLNAQPVVGRDTVVWQFVAGETWQHYPSHIAQLEQVAL